MAGPLPAHGLGRNIKLRIENYAYYIKGKNNSDDNTTNHIANKMSCFSHLTSPYVIHKAKKMKLTGSYKILAPANSQSYVNAP